MPRGAKEGERIQMMIRDLLKEPDNRRCINCNTLGPQYVCTTFWTFVCTNCSAVHRDFSHRVKSLSIGKFSDDEIMALQSGGNERAKQIYFKKWDPQQDSYPDSSNLHGLREFINLVYIDRKYAGDYGSIKLPRVKSESRGNFSEWPCEKPNWGRRDNYSSSERVRYRERDRDECNIFERTSSSGGRRLSLRDFLEERTPRNTQEMPRSQSHTHRSSRVKIVEDRFCESRNSAKETGAIISSPVSLRNTTSLPILRSINDVFKDEAPELRIGYDHEGSDGDQKEAEMNKKANEATNSINLIDFFDDRSVAEQAEQMPSEKTNVESNQVETLLIDLSPPSTASASSTPMLQPSEPAPAQLDCTKSDDVEETNLPENPNSCESLPVTVIPVMQDMRTNHSTFNAGFSSSLQSASSVASVMNEQGNRSSSASDDLRRTKSVPVVQSFQARNEIPEDLFTSSYHHHHHPSFVGGWQTNLPHRAGYNMQFHHPAMTPAGYPVPSKSKNPFDIEDDRSQVQAAAFPYMAPFQGDLPAMAASVVSEFQPSPYASALHSQPQNMYSYGMNMQLVPGAYMAQLSDNMLLTRPEGNANFVRSEDAFASLNPIYRGSGPHSSPAAPPSSSLSRSGNPFG